MKSPKPRNKALRKVDYKNYDAITMRRNYDTKLSVSKLSGEIITGNYEQVYHVAENVGIVWILAYPKIVTVKKNGILNFIHHLNFVS